MMKLVHGPSFPANLASCMQVFDADVAANLRTALPGVKYRARIMREQRSGSLITTATLGGTY
jgi:hypothetical protein